MTEALKSGLERTGRARARLAVGQRFARAVHALRSPVQRWDLTRRLMVGVALAAASFALAKYGWRVFDPSGRAISTTAIDAQERRLREGRARIARLPQMRTAFAPGTQSSSGPADRLPGRDWRAVADLASRTAVTLRALEPVSDAAASMKGRGKGAQQGLQVEGRADFLSLQAFLQGLSTLPVFVIPAAVSIKRESDALSFAAALEVFDGLPAQRAPSPHVRAASGVTEGDKRRSSKDPFGVAGAGAQERASTARLAGFVLDGRRSLALFEGGGVPPAVVGPGQTLGAERVIRIDVGGVTLASRDGARRVELPEDER